MEKQFDAEIGNELSLNTVLNTLITRLTEEEQAELFLILFKVIKNRNRSRSGELLIELYGEQFWPRQWSDR